MTQQQNRVDAPDGAVSTEVTEFVLRGDLMTAYAIRAAADVGVLTALREPGTTVEALVESGLDGQAMGVLLPLLKHYGIADHERAVWMLTPVAERLLTDRIIEALRTGGLGTRIDEAARSFPASFRAGVPAFELEYGLTFWKDLTARPAQEGDFHNHLERTTGGLVASLLERVDLSGVGHIVDLGGGRGLLSRKLLAAQPELRATVVDLGSLARFFPTGAGGQEARLRFHSADLLVDDLPEGEMYLLAQVIHDWPDDRVVDMLSNIASHMPHASRLVVIERIPTEGLASDYAYMSMRMFLMFGARERSPADVQRLARVAGLTLSGIEPLDGGFAAMTLIRHR